MKKLLKKQKGFIVTIELLLISTILVIGLIVGWVMVRDATLAEMSDMSEAIGALDQSYAIAGASNSSNTANTAGSLWQDAIDSQVDFNFGPASTSAVGTDFDFYPAQGPEGFPAVVASGTP